MKAQLLSLLKSNNEEFLSGEQISQQLGTSRVSIWKHIKKLQELGYEIESSPTGYKLLASPDALFPWEFANREEFIRYYPEVDSTMIEAKQLARKGCPAFTVVIAERQIKGRGRLKRGWVSDSGGLYFTLILRPDIPPAMMSRYNFAASLCLAKTLQECFDIDAKVKWPNDILVNEKKLCGMLSEMEMESDMVAFLNIGIGLNVNNNPTDQEPNATSVRQLKGEIISRKLILSMFLDKLQQEIENSDLSHIIPQWKEQTITLKRKVRIATTNETWEGIARDVDDTGALILELEDGSHQKVFYGDCFHND